MMLNSLVCEIVTLYCIERGAMVNANFDVNKVIKSREFIVFETK